MAFSYKTGTAQTYSGYSFKFNAFLAYEVVTNNDTTYSIRLNGGAQLTNTSDAVGINDFTVSIAGTGQTTKTNSDLDFRHPSKTDSAQRQTAFSNFTWTWTKGTSSASKTITCTLSNSGMSTSTATLTVTVPAKTSYTVTYKANGGTGSDLTSTKWHGTNLTLRSSGFTRTNYTLTGWNTNTGGTGTAYGLGATYSGNANLTLYAQWKLNYLKPTISGASVYRVATSGSTSESDTGEVIRVQFTYTGGTNDGGSTYITPTCAITIDGDTVTSPAMSSSGTVNAYYTGPYTVNSGHTVVIKLYDSNDTTGTTVTLYVGAAVFPLDIMDDGTAMGLMTAAVSGQAVTTSDLYADSVHGDTVEVDGNKIYQLFEVTTETFSMSINASSYGDDSSQTFTKAGYFPIGIVGWSITGTNGTLCFIPRLYLSSVGAGTCDLFIRVRNTATSAASINLGIRVLWVKIV